MMSTSSTDRWAALNFGPPAADVEETEAPVLVDYLSEGRVARITLNRPHADNAITTEMGALLTEVVEEIAVRTAVRVVVLTGAGDSAFSVGSDLRQRKAMTKQDWLRQRQAFDRTLYTVRQLRKPSSPRALTSSSPRPMPPSDSQKRCSAWQPAAARRRCCPVSCPAAGPSRCS
jgi:hypothetical protein